MKDEKGYDVMAAFNENEAEHITRLAREDPEYCRRHIVYMGAERRADILDYMTEHRAQMSVPAWVWQALAGKQ